MPVDLYVGGAEHAVLHLLYARFWHKVLYDCGVVSTKEPFHRLINQGMITSFAFQRKSKSLVAVDAVEEKDGKYYAKDDGEELERVVAKMSKPFCFAIFAVFSSRSQKHFVQRAPPSFSFSNPQTNLS